MEGLKISDEGQENHDHKRIDQEIEDLQCVIQTIIIAVIFVLIIEIEQVLVNIPSTGISLSFYLIPITILLLIFGILGTCKSKYANPKRDTNP